MLFGLSSNQFYLFNTLVVKKLHVFNCEVYVIGPRAGNAFDKTADLDVLIETTESILSLDQIIEEVETSELGICINFYFSEEFSERFLKQLEIEKIHLGR